MLEDAMISSLHITPFQVDGEVLYCDVSSAMVGVKAMKILLFF
jgi:hypothetical protein